VKRFLTLSLILSGLVIGYLLASAPVRDRLSRLFALDYEIPVEVRQAEKSFLGRPLTTRGALEPVAAGAVVAAVEAEDLSERLADQEAAIKEAEAHNKASESELAAAEKQLAELRDLYQKNLIARREVDQAEAAAKTARVQREAAQAQLAQRTSLSAQTRHVLHLAQITAPVAGVVTRRWSEPGAAVPEAAPILSIAPTDTLKIMLKLRSVDAEKIPPGMSVKVKVDALPGTDFRGKVTRVQELANFTGDESSVEIELANPGGALKFGMPVSVSFSTGERRDGIFVPKSALVEIHGKPYVYINEGGKARQRNVTPGKQYDGEIEVVSGLEPGEAVVVKGVERLGDGSRVRAVD
jgi:RND family efflux transporter MFP subunit